MNWGSLAGGLAEGLGSGYRTGMLATNLKNQNEMEQRRMGIVEEDARQRRQINDLTVQRHQRDMDREAREEASYKEALSALMPDPSNVDPNLPASEQFGRTLMGMKPNAAQWTAAANALAKNGNTKALEFMNFAWKAREEGAFDALHALTRGDMEGAKNAFNAAGQHRLKSIEPTGEGPDGTQSGVFKFTYDDGSSETHNVREAFSMLSSPSAYARYTQDIRKQQEESEKNQADIELKQAQASNARGDNPTKIRVAEIGAQKALDVADRRANRKGGGKGGAGGDDGEVDWKDAKARHDINADIMNAAVAQFSKTPLDPVSGKKAPDEYSRNLGEKASRVYLKALEGGRPMTIESSLRIANEGQVTYATKLDPSGRLMTKPGISLNGTVYDDGSVEKPATKQQVIEYLDSTRARAVEKGTQITADMLKDVPIDKWAKQAGMKPQELIDRLVSGPPTPKGEQAGGEPASKGSGGIVSSAQAQETGARPARGSGVASQASGPQSRESLDQRIGIEEARLRNSSGLTSAQRHNIETGIATLRAQRDATTPTDKVQRAREELATAESRLRELQGRKLTTRDTKALSEIQDLKTTIDALRQQLKGVSPTRGISREQMR